MFIGNFIHIVPLLFIHCKGQPRTAALLYVLVFSPMPWGRLILMHLLQNLIVYAQINHIRKLFRVLYPMHMYSPDIDIDVPVHGIVIIDRFNDRLHDFCRIVHCICRFYECIFIGSKIFLELFHHLVCPVTWGEGVMHFAFRRNDCSIGHPDRPALIGLNHFALIIHDLPCLLFVKYYSSFR